MKYYALTGIREREVPTHVTAKGQVTLPKAAPEVAGIRPGDRLTDCVRPEGGAIVEVEAAVENEQAYLSRTRGDEPAPADSRIVDGKHHADDPGRGLIFIDAKRHADGALRS